MSDDADSPDDADGSAADDGRRHGRVQRHPTPGPLNSLQYWTDAKPVWRVALNYVLVWIARIAPSLRVRNWALRRLGVTASECRIQVDYIDQSVDVYVDSNPEYVVDDGEVHHRVEGVVEQPTVPNGEPLRHQLSAFVDAVRTGSEPPVTAEDGVRAVELANRIDRLAAERTEVHP